MKSKFHEGETISSRRKIAEAARYPTTDEPSATSFLPDSVLGFVKQTLAVVCVRPVSGSQLIIATNKRLVITVAGAASGLSNNKFDAPNFPFNSNIGSPQNPGEPNKSRPDTTTRKLYKNRAFVNRSGFRRLIARFNG